MAIFDFEEERDWNGACWCILQGATSLPSFNSIASLLVEIVNFVFHQCTNTTDDVISD